MIKLLQLIKELNINKPSLFDKLKPGNEYWITYILYGNKITDAFRFVKYIDNNTIEVIDLEYEDSLAYENYKNTTLFKDKVILITPYKDEINELEINNPNKTADEVYKFWENNIYLGKKYNIIRDKYIEEFIDVNKLNQEEKYLDPTELLIYNLPQHGLNKFWNDLQILYKEQPERHRGADINESLNRFVKIDEIYNILSNEFPEYKNKIRKYIDTIEIEPENYEDLTYHHLLDDFKNFVEGELNELEINNPNVTTEKLWKYMFPIIKKLISDDNRDIWINYNDLCRKYIGFAPITQLIELEQLSQKDLNGFYRELKQIVQHIDD